MRCLKCGMEIEDNSKFCGYCGNPVEHQAQPVAPGNVGSITQQPAIQNNLNAAGLNIVPPVEPAVSAQQLAQQTPQVSSIPVAPATPAVSAPSAVVPEPSNVQTQVTGMQQPIPEVQQQMQQPVQQPVLQVPNAGTPIDQMPVNNVVDSSVEARPKKKSNVWMFILCGAIFIVVAVVLFVMSLNKPSVTTNSIAALESSLNNVIEKGKNSGTIVARFSVSGEDQNVDLNAKIKYQKLSNELNLEVDVDKSEFFDEINLFVNANESSINLYTKSNLVDMILGTVSSENKWLKLNSQDMNLNFSQLNIEKISFSELGISNKIKYINKENGLSHYQLTIDKELLNTLQSEYFSELNNDLDDSLNLGIDKNFEGTYYVDFYVNNYNEIEKISIDMTDMMSDESITKAILEIEFKDFNSTTITIPTDALNSTSDLQTYITENLQINFSSDEIE